MGSQCGHHPLLVQLSVVSFFVDDDLQLSTHIRDAARNDIVLPNKFDGVDACEVSNPFCQVAHLIGQCPLPRNFGFGVLDKVSIFQLFTGGIINDGLNHLILGML